MGRHYDGAAGLPQKYKVSAKQPIDIREIVDTFDDLLDNRTTFYNSAYKGMRVLVLDESCVYEMVADTFSKLPSDWKRLTIETVTTKEALQRAKDNLVNGALIYISKDIDKRDVLKFDGYFGEGTEVIVKDDLNTEGLPIGCFDGLVGAGAVFCYYSPGESREYLVKDVSDGKYNNDSDLNYIYENAEDGKRYLMVNGFLEPYEESDNSENIEQKAGLYFCEKGVLTMAGGRGGMSEIPDGGVTEEKIADGAVTENKLGDDVATAIGVMRDKLDILYKVVLSFSGGGNKKKGTSVNVTLSWTVKVNGTAVNPSSQTLNGEALDVTLRSKTFTGVTADTTYTLVVDGVQATQSVKFYNPSYFGVVAPDYQVSSDVSGLTEQTNYGSRALTKTVTASGSMKVAYLYPSALGALASIKDGNNFDVTGSFTKTADITINGEKYIAYLLTQEANINGLTFKFA